MIYQVVKPIIQITCNESKRYDINNAMQWPSLTFFMYLECVQKSVMVGMEKTGDSGGLWLGKND